jgi:hypothetical protein
VQADPEIYLKDEIASVSFSQAQIKLLTEHAENLFIYGTTAVQYIGPGGGRRLKATLELSSNSSGKQYAKIDVLYAMVISNALNIGELVPWEAETSQLILQTVICAREPMAIEVLASLIKLNNNDVAGPALGLRRSVIYVSETQQLLESGALAPSLREALARHRPAPSTLLPLPLSPIPLRI